jgi:hypothetical protein
MEWRALRLKLGVEPTGPILDGYPRTQRAAEDVIQLSKSAVLDHLHE